MGVALDFKHNGGVLLNRYEKQQQIFIPRDSWLQIIALRPDIQQSLDTKKEQKWAIGNNLCVQTSLYHDAFLTHIRIWWGDQPTKQGVSLHESDWVHFSSFLQLDEETSLGQTVIETMLADDLEAFINDNCEGCRHHYASQTEHACVMESKRNAERFIDNVFDRLNVFEFICKLAEKGKEKRIVIKRPYDTFAILKSIKDDEVKLNTLGKF